MCAIFKISSSQQRSSISTLQIKKEVIATQSFNSYLEKVGCVQYMNHPLPRNQFGQCPKSKYFHNHFRLYFPNVHSKNVMHDHLIIEMTLKLVNFFIFTFGHPVAGNFLVWTGLVEPSVPVRRDSRPGPTRQPLTTSISWLPARASQGQIYTFNIYFKLNYSVFKFEGFKIVNLDRQKFQSKEYIFWCKISGPVCRKLPARPDRSLRSVDHLLSPGELFPDFLVISQRIIRPKVGGLYCVIVVVCD